MAKHTKLIFIFWFALSTSTFAQKVVDLGNVDFLSKTGKSVEMKFLKKHSETVYTEVLLKTNDGNVTVEIDTLESKDLKQYQNLVPVQSIKPMDKKDWERLLTNKTFYMGKGEQNDGVQTFTTHNKSIMSTAYYHSQWWQTIDTLAKYDYPYSMVNTKFYNYIYLKLQNNRYIVAMVRPYESFSHIEELIVPYQHSFDFIITNHQFKYNAGYEADEANSKHHANNKLGLTNLFKKEKTATGKYQLTDFFNQPISVIAVDSIFFSQNNIYTYDKVTNSYNIYTNVGEKLPYKRVRAVKQNIAPQILIGNEVKYLVYNKLQDDEPDSKVRFICGTINYYRYQIGHKKKGIQLKLEENFFGGKAKTTNYKLTNTGNIDSLYFQGGSQEWNFNDNNFDASSNQTLYTKSKTGKYNIATFAISQEDKTFTITKQLSQDCDSLKMQYPNYFYNNELMGYYPAMKEAKYKTIEKVVAAFLRYEKTNGKKGWLNINTKIEYPD